MLDLARHIVDQNSRHFKPENFEDHYEAALIDLINQKRAGRPIVKQKVKTEGNVINLMDALRQSLKGSKGEAAPTAKNGKVKKRVEGQREMLLPIEGKGQKAAAKAKA